jgi:predicted MFS family arabinose efflux permease
VSIFLGFSATQLPLGSALDRSGPRRVLLALLSVALPGCIAFSLVRSFVGLTLARGLIGVGVSACLMAPMTSYRQRFAPVVQMRANSWMLMTGSMGMVASTLPVQWLLPHMGRRGLFWLTAALTAISMLLIALIVPADEPWQTSANRESAGYAAVFRHRTFVRFAPIGLFHYGGMIAVQSLWAGPWPVQVCRWTPNESAQGLFAINIGMLLSLMAWGVVPRLYQQVWTAHSLMARGMPLSVGVLVLAIGMHVDAVAWVWALFCITCTVGALSQPAIAQAYPAALAGRALSAYKLVVFAGVFGVQWAIGLVIDHFRSLSWATLASSKAAFASLAGCCVLSYGWFIAFDDDVRLNRKRALS